MNHLIPVLIYYSTSSYNSFIIRVVILSESIIYFLCEGWSGESCRRFVCLFVSFFCFCFCEGKPVCIFALRVLSGPCKHGASSLPPPPSLRSNYTVGKFACLWWGFRSFSFWLCPQLCSPLRHYYYTLFSGTHLFSGEGRNKLCTFWRGKILFPPSIHKSW